MDWNGQFNSDDHYIYYCGRESLTRNGVAIIVKKRVRSAVLGCSLKNDRMISVNFQGKPFNITVIQAFAPTSNAKEAEWFYEDLQYLLELTPIKDVLFIIGDWNAEKRRKRSRNIIWYRLYAEYKKTWYIWSLQNRNMVSGGKGSWWGQGIV